MNSHKVYGGTYEAGSFFDRHFDRYWVLVVVALAVFFTRQDTQTYVSDETPEGVVHNYVVAVLNKEYEKAYGYLADLDNKPTYEEFRDAFLTGMVNPNNSAVDIGGI